MAARGSGSATASGGSSRRTSRRSLQLRRSLPDGPSSATPLWDGGEVVTDGGDAATDEEQWEGGTGSRDGNTEQSRRGRGRRRRRSSSSGGGGDVRSGAPDPAQLTIEDARAELQRLERRLVDLKPTATGATHLWKVNRLSSKLKRAQAAAAPPPWYNCPKIETHSGTVAEGVVKPTEGQRARRLRARRRAAKRDQLASLSLERVDMADLQSEWLAGLDVAEMQRISPKDSAIGAWIAQHSEQQQQQGASKPRAAAKAGGAGGGKKGGAAASVPTVPPVVRARALHDWNVAAGAAEDDLHFSAGDEFSVVSDEPGQGWLTGSIHDSATGETKAGIFPGNFVDIITPQLHEKSQELQRSKKGLSRARKQRQDKLAQPKSRGGGGGQGSPRASRRGLSSGSAVDVSGHVSVSELLGPMPGDESTGWRGACMCVSLRRPDGGWHEKGWKENAAVEGTVPGTAGAASAVPPREGAFSLHALGPNAGLGAVFTIADDPVDYSDGADSADDPRTAAVCGIVAVHPRSFAAVAGVAPEMVVVAINGELCAAAAEGGAVMSRRAAVLAMLEEAVHGGADHVELHLATPQRWRNAVRPRLLEEFGSSSQQQQPVFPLFYEQGGCGGGVRVHPLYWSLGPDEMCVTVEYTALNALGQPVDGHVTGAEIQSTSDFYLAAVQLREAMGDSFGPETPSGSPELPVSLLPAVGISKGVRSAKGTFEVQLAKRWDTGLELYSIAPLALPHGQAPGYSNSGDMGGGAGEAMMVGGDSSTTQEAETGQRQIADTPATAAGSAGETQKESRFSLPSDTESAIVTKIGETLGFWVAGDDITYDTFGACAELSILLMRIDHLACLHHRLYPAASRLRVQLLTAQY
jgi:hypothetical protein